MMDRFYFDEELIEDFENKLIDIGKFDKNKKIINDKENCENCTRLKIDTLSSFVSLKNNNCGPNNFDLLSVLGKGGYGKVYLAKKCVGVNKGQLYAMKVIKKSILCKNRKDIDHTISERNILESIKHPFIVDLIYAFQTTEKLYLIMEYLSGGELFMQLEKRGFLKESVARFYLAQITLAISYLHENGIIYRDLKPENIMLTDKGNIKLTDFGLSKECLNSESQTNTFCGTIEYMAPEIITRVGHGYTADWWSVGAVMYDMLTGQPPFVHESRKRTIHLILNGQLIFRNGLSEPAKNLICNLLKKNPSDRYGYGSDGKHLIFNHLFFETIDWDQLYLLQIPPPYIPPIAHPTDTQMFDPYFTKMAISETPSNDFEIFNDDIFHGFSYVNPSYDNN